MVTLPPTWCQPGCVELIFASLYEHQADPSTIMSWLAERGYGLAGFFDEHFSREGLAVRIRRRLCGGGPTLT